MLSQVRRGHHQDFDGGPLSARPSNNYDDQWRYLERTHSSYMHNNILPDPYPVRSNSTVFNPELSRALRVDTNLLAIIRIDDKRNNYYSAEVVSKLRQKEQARTFINKPCSLYVNDRFLFIVDRITQSVAETIPLEHIDATCVQSDSPDTLNDIFMYRLIDRSMINGESSTVVVFKCSNKESKVLVDSIRHGYVRPARPARSDRSQGRNYVDRVLPEGPILVNHNQNYVDHEPSASQNSIYVVGPQHSRASANRPTSPALPKADHYKRMTTELNKCFDDIELFVRYLETITNYTKTLENDQPRRKGKKNSMSNRSNVERLPDDKYFVDILQKFKHSFNLIGELKTIIHNPNGPELIHYLLTPLQMVILTLRQNHPNQLQLVQGVWTPALTRDARELLLNCLTSRELDIIKSLGSAWIRSAEETPVKSTDYRPIFFEGRNVWLIENSNGNRSESEDYQPAPAVSTRINQKKLSATTSVSSTAARTNSPRNATRHETPSLDRSAKTAPTEMLNSKMQNEHAWAISRFREHARICAVTHGRDRQHPKELTVRQGELVEVQDDSKNWWKVENFRSETGFVPKNLLEDIQIEERSGKISLANPSAYFPRSSSVPLRGYPPGFPQAYPQSQLIIRSPSNSDNFILQSANSTETNLSIENDEIFRNPLHAKTKVSNFVPETTNSAPPAPPAPPLPEQFLTSRSLNWSTLRSNETGTKDRTQKKISEMTTPRNEELQLELAQRINDRVRVINAHSTRDEVQRWLASKQFSPQLMKNLQGFNGEKIFKLSKSSIDRLTNESESNRLNALLNQQKQLSGFPVDENSEKSPTSNHFGFASLKSNPLRDDDENFFSRNNDSLSRSLKIKLKQRRDKIELAESTAQIDV